MECMVRHGSRETTIRDGLAQTAAYMDRLGAASGHLVIFDRSAERSWQEKIYRCGEEHGAGASPSGGCDVDSWTTRV